VHIEGEGRRQGEECGERAGRGEYAGAVVTRRIRLDLGYDGAGFLGWARQAEGRTVQGELEAALITLLRATAERPAPRLVVAGRTDAGVHARGQVAHLDFDEDQWDRLASLGRPPRDPLATLVRKLNGLAGRVGDLRVHRATLAPEGFDARFAAVWRRYEYRIADTAATKDPLARGSTLWHPRPLDVAAMDAAARELAAPGLADWAAYCRPRVGATTIRDLQEYRWERSPDGVLVARVQADAFCHSMVRALVGACVAVGEGALPPEAPRELQRAGARTQAFKVVPAHGLVLTEVGYPPAAELAGRAAQTRGLRTLDEHPPRA